MSDEPGPDQAGEVAATEADEPAPFLTLAEVLAAAAEDVTDITTETDGESTTWSAAGRAFATLIGEWAEFRLDPMVARLGREALS